MSASFFSIQGICGLDFDYSAPFGSPANYEEKRSIRQAPTTNDYGWFWHSLEK